MYHQLNVELWQYETRFRPFERKLRFLLSALPGGRLQWGLEPGPAPSTWSELYLYTLYLPVVLGGGRGGGSSAAALSTAYPRLVIHPSAAAPDVCFLDGFLLGSMVSWCCMLVRFVIERLSA